MGIIKMMLCLLLGTFIGVGLGTMVTRLLGLYEGFGAVVIVDLGAVAGFILGIWLGGSWVEGKWMRWK